MFGFLRRKKPAPTPAAPVETFAPLEAFKPLNETAPSPPEPTAEGSPTLPIADAGPTPAVDVAAPESAPASAPVVEAAQATSALVAPELPRVETQRPLPSSPPETPGLPPQFPAKPVEAPAKPDEAPVKAAEIPVKPVEAPIKPVEALGPAPEGWGRRAPPRPSAPPTVAPPVASPAPAPVAPATPGVPATPEAERRASPPSTSPLPAMGGAATPAPVEPVLAHSDWVRPSDLPPAPIERPKAVDAVADTGQVAGSDERKGWMSRLRKGLGKTRGNIVGLLRLTRIDEDLFEELETALLTSDAGFEATERLLSALRSRVKSQALSSGEQVRQALSQLIAEALMPLEKPIDIDEALPLVMMITGVNGAGKTTSIGKLTHHLQREGKSILLAAGDTFRAAAREQLATWGSRNDVQVIAQQGGDPAAVAFDAVSAGIARSTGVVMVDTAGRLPTQTHLMDELKKIKRVLGKAMHGAPHQTLLILDGNTGQNMLAQVKAFDEAVGLTGLIITKLDGTAKGGALLGLAWQQRDRPIPVYFIGVGEGIDDLQAFSAVEFADAVTGLSET